MPNTDRSNVRRRIAVLPLLLLFFLSGCSVTEFATAYFNTYYNAQRVFGEAEDDVWNQPDTRQAGRSYLTRFNIPAATKTKFISVIEKCSKLLQYHDRSSLVDDALFMIGKSYFYQEDLEKAERKFKELITDYPESGLLIKTRLLLAYTTYKKNDLTAAQAQAKEVLALADADGDDDSRSRAALLLGQIERMNRNFAQAGTYYQEAADYTNDDAQRVVALTNVAEMRIETGNFGEAEKAYRAATDASSNYATVYKGRIGTARMLARQGRYREALDILAVLREDLNNKEFFGEIDLETAIVYTAMGDLDAAITQHRYVDTLYARTEVSANSYYRLGQLYEERLGMYDSARVAYNKGKTEFPVAAVTPMLMKRSEYMNRYAQYINDISKYDTLLAAVLSPAAKPDSTMRDTVKISHPTSIADSGRAGRSTLAADSIRVVRPVLTADSIRSRLAMDKSELGALFYTSFGRTDSALVWLSLVVIEYPSSPYVPRALYTMAQIYGQDSTVSREKVDSLYREVIRRFPDSEFAAESRRVLGLPPIAPRVDQAQELYFRAETLMQDGKGKEALTQLKEIASRYPASPLSARAQYAMGWVYEHLTDQPDSALAWYSRIVKTFPGSPYAVDVQPKVTAAEMERLNRERKAAADSLQMQTPALPKPQPAVKDSTKVRKGER